jgi:hypothetical protein
MLGSAVAAEDQMRVAIDQPGSHPGAAERHDLLRPEAGHFGALADAQDAAVLDGDGGVADDAQRPLAGARLHGREMAVDEEAVPHAIGHKRTGC